MFSWDVLPSVVLVFHLAFAMVGGCSFIPGTEPRKYSMTETLQKASVVLSGTDVYHAQRDDGRRNYTFDVSCVFKSNGLNIPRTIFLLDVGAISCDGTDMDPVGKSYIVGLQVATAEFIKNWGPSEDYFGKDSDVPYYFTMDEPEATNTAAFDVNPGNLNITSRLCGMNNTFTYLGEGAPGDHQCPTRSVTPETCVSGASGSLTTQIKNRVLGALLLAVVFCVLQCVGVIY